MAGNQRHCHAVLPELHRLGHVVPPELHHLFGGPSTGPAPAGCEGFALVRLDAAAFRLLQRTAELQQLVDALGVDSARAQRLVAPVTVFAKLRLSNDRVYVAVYQPAAEAVAPEPTGGGAPSRMAVGLLKVGEKDLFHWSRDGTVRELRRQRCVLDFYVAEAFQRRGLGKELFETMLAQEHCQHPAALAYDRPSPKLLGFLAKHHALTEYVPQQNQFVLFDDLIRQAPPPKRSVYDSVSMRPLTARGAPATRW